MWERVELPGLRPVCGFTFPQRGVLYVLVPGGLVRVTLDPVAVRRMADADAVAMLDGSHAGWLVGDGERHLVYDADGGDITLCDHPSGDRIVPDEDGTLLITDPDERAVRQRIPSVRLPADGSWLWAGFSDDGRWLVAGEPGGVQVFRRTPDAEPGAAADSRGRLGS